MLSRIVWSSRALATRTGCYPYTTHQISDRKTQFPVICTSFPATQNPRRVLKRMASQGQQFPPQRQEGQPGKEHVMDPLPQATSPNYKPANKLQGKVAIVTGGDSGIGRSVCHCFALEGATVAFTYVKSQEDKDAHDTLQMLRQIKRNDAKEPMAIPADLGFDDHCRRVVNEVVKAYGQVDILVNNAAEQYKATSIEEIDEERLVRVFRTNIFSYFFMACSRAYEERKLHNKHHISDCIQGKPQTAGLHSNQRCYCGFHKRTCTSSREQGNTCQRRSSGTDLDSIDTSIIQ
ncbi:hypothetical protein L1049_020008 [Liquidambar formosana]|uniref:Uncharacterized protein n=1 Tax=Liquidambar formosana TaxID=63359 RepID=A0AAP0SDD4_LIQFO